MWQLPSVRWRPLRLASLCVVLALAACGGGSSHTATSPHSAARTVYARGLAHVSALTFDARGRLWATTSGASTHGSDGLWLVAARGARPVRVARLRGPLGLVWVGSSLYVSSLDGVDRFSGLRGTRFAHRARILRGPVAGAENNNLVRAPGGRLLMGVSATCDHCTTTPRYSGAIVSFTTRGTGLRVYASGIRAAYGLLFDGSVLYASMNQRDDLGAKTPGDWLAIVRAGENWGFPACYGQAGSACTGVPKPLGVLDPHAAAGGIAIRGGVALVAEWNRGKVLAVTLKGGAVSTFAGGFEHPLPLLARLDGTVLVGDWGTGIVWSLR